jgi:uncharacterized protein YjbJ (UPF0337 family)
MKASTDDRIKGKFRELRGKLLKCTATFSGDPEWEAEGRQEKKSGKVQQVIAPIEKVPGRRSRDHRAAPRSKTQRATS